MFCRTRLNFGMRSKLLVFLALAALCSGGLVAAAEARFNGRIVLRWVDENQFVAAMQLVENFSFMPANGKAWVVPAGAVVDGRSMSPLFVQLAGHPFEGGFRKTAIIYDYATKEMSQPWQDAQHIFFEGRIECYPQASRT